MMFVCWGLGFIVFMWMALWWWVQIWGVLKMVLAVIAGVLLAVVDIILEPFKAAYRTGGVPRLLATIVGIVVVIMFLTFIFNII